MVAECNGHSIATKTTIPTVRPGVTKRIGILVVGHGTRSALGTAEFVEVVERIRREIPEWPIEYGFLEFAEPTIDIGTEALYSKGVTSILVAPLLLFAAGHAKEDIPRAAREATDRRGISICGHAEVLGLHPRLIELSLARFRAASETLPPKPAFVLVGRGNRDSEAQRAAVQFVRSCSAVADVSMAKLGYLAMAEPSIESVLIELGEARISGCVLIPHLLFHGDLVDRCERLLDSIASRFPNTQWRLAARLGADPAVAKAAVDRIRSALSAILRES